MRFIGARDAVILFLGDLSVFVLALYLSLSIRHLELSGFSQISDHFLPFLILFVVWIMVFYIAGLYEKKTLLFRQSLPVLLFKTQSFNVLVAVLFFYFIPYFGITPKSILFIYLIVSTLLVILWRFYSYSVFRYGSVERAVIIGEDPEMQEIYQAIHNSNRFSIDFLRTISSRELESESSVHDLVHYINRQGVTLVVIDLQNQNISNTLPGLYKLLFNRVTFIDFQRLYMDLFDRVPLSSGYHWVLERLSVRQSLVYDSLKRMMDILLSLPLAVFTVLFLPLIALVIKLEDHGPVFILQRRVGLNNRIIKIVKFRTMTCDDEGRDDLKGKNRITKFGSFLRKTRIDELPQVWNVLKGDLSLIGPRPELPELADRYGSCIPYYNARHLITPGLSGWAQLYHETPPKRDLDVVETERKLSYDLFYLVNRSFWLDISIALKTIKALLSRSGR